MVRQRVVEVLDGLVSSGKAIGALAEVRDETGWWSCSAGVAQIGTDEPVDPAGHFRIGSVTKTYTATAVLQLVGDGRLDLRDSVETWLPGLVPGGSKITVRHLLSHTSGLFNYTNTWFEGEESYDALVRERFRRWSPPEIVALATRREPLFEPGTSRTYNNTGYILAGMIVEAAGGRSYADHLEDRILAPLHLKDTYVRNDLVDLPEPHAHGYLPAFGEVVDVTLFDRSQAGSAGGIVSTAADVNRFFAGLLNGALLKPEVFAEMFTPMPLDIPALHAGLGLNRFDLPSRAGLPNGVQVWGKDGSFLGFDAWSFHTVDARRQLTVSASSAAGESLDTYSLLVDLAFVFAE